LKTKFPIDEVSIQKNINSVNLESNSIPKIVDVSILDIKTPDLPSNTPNLSIPNIKTPDIPIPNIKTPDLPTVTPNLPTPNIKTPDLPTVTPNLPTPNIKTPDLPTVTPNLPIPNIKTPDLLTLRTNIEINPLNNEKKSKSKKLKKSENSNEEKYSLIKILTTFDKPKNKEKLGPCPGT